MAQKTIGLALSGGGARGFAHLGVIKALTEGGIRFDVVTGTSAGSFVGAAIASGMPIEEVIRIGSRVTWFNMAGLSYSPRALLSNAAMGAFIRQNFSSGRIEDLELKYAAVACDLNAAEQVVLSTGDVSFAVRASCAVPGVFSPTTDDEGRMLIDGGVLNPLPADVARRLGADVVIGVDLLACGASFRTTPKTALGMLFQSAMILLRAASRQQGDRGDVVIEPEIAHIRPDEIGKRDELIRLGEEAGGRMLTQIKELVGS